MKPLKIFILLPDGIGLRNFAYTSFVKIGKARGWDIVFWNHTPFGLTELGYKEIKLHGKARTSTDLLKRAKINSELDYFKERFNDDVYQTYKFTPVKKGLKSKIKNLFVSQLEKTYRGENGLLKLREKMKASERKSGFYNQCRVILERERPDFIFCTNQRPVNAIAPLIAAQDLGIPSGTFIFSWDNLSKATMVVETDYYFVWSKFMRAELMKYYPAIEEGQIKVTGTPQFEAYFDHNLIQSKTSFFKQYNLDDSKQYICFSGDDETTSPFDPQYLEDIAATVKDLNVKGFSLGVIFRRCPVDFSDRYAEVLEKYRDTITEIKPIWTNNGGSWNTSLPLKEDLSLQVNTLHHCFGVINLGSTMVFDAVTQKKPCFYLNYNVKNVNRSSWNVTRIYNYVHFRSMPSKKAVIWLNHKEDISEKIIRVLNTGAPEIVEEAALWFQVINEHPPEEASRRIWKGISEITNNHNKPAHE